MRHLFAALLLIPALAFAADAAPSPKKEACCADGTTCCEKHTAAAAKCADCKTAKAADATAVACAKCLAAIKECADCKKLAPKAAEKPAAK